MPYAVDVIDLKKKREHIASSMEFPPLPPHLAGPVNGVPVFFIVNLMMPSYEYVALPPFVHVKSLEDLDGRCCDS